MFRFGTGQAEVQHRAGRHALTGRTAGPQQAGGSGGAGAASARILRRQVRRQKGIFDFQKPAAAASLFPKNFPGGSAPDLCTVRVRPGGGQGHAMAGTEHSVYCQTSLPCYNVRGEVAVAPSLRFGSGTAKYSAARHAPLLQRAG